MEWGGRLTRRSVLRVCQQRFKFSVRVAQARKRNCCLLASNTFAVQSFEYSVHNYVIIETARN